MDHFSQCLIIYQAYSWFAFSREMLEVKVPGFTHLSVPKVRTELRLEAPSSNNLQSELKLKKLQECKVIIDYLDAVISGCVNNISFV